MLPDFLDKALKHPRVLWNALGRYKNSWGTTWQPQRSTGTLMTTGGLVLTWHQAIFLKRTEIKPCFPDVQVLDSVTGFLYWVQFHKELSFWCQWVQVRVFSIVNTVEGCWFWCSCSWSWWWSWKWVCQDSSYLLVRVWCRWLSTVPVWIWLSFFVRVLCG